MISQRFFHLTKTMSASIQMSSLAKLRKATGYSMSNCKKALELHADIAKAEQWLHEEAKRQGWSKIANLEHKSAAQGLIGICIKDSIAAMVEVNCETDFVAKNVEFQSLVSKVLTSCLDHTLVHNSLNDCTKIVLDSDALTKLSVNSTLLGDLAASAVGKFGEKTIIRRAVCFKSKNNVILSSFSHPLSKCPDLLGATLGKYGGLIAFTQKNINSEICEPLSVTDIGHQLCQHIVGMNPLTVGNIEDVKPVSSEPEIAEELGAKIIPPEQREDIILNDVSTNAEQIDVEMEPKDEEAKLVDANEDRLVHQQFLLDPSIHVAEFLKKNSIEILDFHRFECGEIIKEEQ